MIIRIFYIVLLLAFSIGVNAQKLLDRKVSLELTEKQFDEVIEEIKDQTDVSFSYFADLFQANQRFTIYKRDKTLKEVLDFLVLGTNITYGVFKNQIIFYRPKPKPAGNYAASGVVIDSLSGKTIQNVHIYLDRTDIGTYTDVDGSFELTDVPEGSYDMVVSHVGYGVFNYRMNLYKDASGLQIKITPKINMLKELEVVSLNSVSQKRFIDLFRREVFGDGPTAKLCLINNPEDLYVFKDSAHKKDEFEIYSKGPISISNHWLGYSIYMDLVFFETKAEQTVFIVKTNFQPMRSESKRVRKRWQKNRLDMYTGSLRHFVASLDSDNKGKSRFRQKIVEEIPNELRFKYLPADILSKDVVKLVSVIRGLNEGYFVEIRHPSTQSVSYLSKTDFEYKADYKFELIKDFYDPKKGVMIYGKWAYNRLAETLPLNYTTNKKNLRNN
ncbi:MAG: carboxypeptidase-like regulatory domain-containing protein [Cyclobacteriaceae bacterium]